MNDYLELHALYHHGVKGQKWGIRRFQNEDGSLTPEGHKRLAEVSELTAETFAIDRDAREMARQGKQLLLPSDAHERYAKGKAKLDKLLKQYGKMGVHFIAASRVDLKTGEEFVGVMFDNGTNINDKRNRGSIYETRSWW